MAGHVMLRILPGDIPEKGLRVRYRCGESYGKEIEWGEVSEGVLVASDRVNNLNERGLNFADSDAPGYAGFDQRAGTYWRFAHDSDPDVYREYCMQIIYIDQEFQPSSAWEAWRISAQDCSKNRLYTALKNSVTGAELSYKILGKGLGYQLKDLGYGLRAQKMIRHDYLLNRLLGTSYRKLDHQKQTVTAHADIEGGSSVGMDIAFIKENLVFKYQVNELDITLGIFDSSHEELELIKMLKLPHSSLFHETPTLLL